MRPPVAILFALLLLAGCNFVRLDAGPAETVPVTDDVSPQEKPLPEMSNTPAPAIAAVVATVTPAPAIEAATPSPVPGPWRHTVREGETLGFIIQRYGYRDYAVMDAIVQLNENIPNPNLLPGEGSVILVPRPTATALPANFTPLPVPPALAERIVPTSPDTGLNYDTEIAEHVVVAGQTVIDIVIQHDTTLEIVSILNPDISFSRCDFGLRSGGPECNPLLNVGQTVRVPAPTLTPTLSPTFSGRETATPTPTWIAPRIVSPAQDSVLPAAPIRLQWLSVGVLPAGDVYLVQISDQGGVVHNAVTRDTSLLLPESMVPAGGTPVDLTWTVSVARADENGVYGIISGYPSPQRFRWNSR